MTLVTPDFGPTGPGAVPTTSVTAQSDVGRAPALSDILAEVAERVAPHRPATVALIGNYGNGNLGDEAILRGVLEAFGDRVEVTVMSRTPARVAALHGVRSLSMLSIAGVRRLLGVDLVAVGGGGIFGNNMGLLPRLLPFIGLAVALSGRNFAFVAIGAYRTTPAVVQWALRALARRAVMVSVRDRESAEVLGASSAHVVPDPGASISAAPAVEVDALLEGWDRTGPILGISLKPTVEAAFDETQVKIAAQAVEAWSERHIDARVLLMCMSDVGNFGLGTGHSDRTMAEQLVSAYPDLDVLIVGPDLSPWHMKGVIGRCDAVIAHRLHAQLFAHDEGVPLFGLTWERKSDVFLESAGIPHVNLSSDTGDDVVAWVNMIGGQVSPSASSR